MSKYLVGRNSLLMPKVSARDAKLLEQDGIDNIIILISVIDWLNDLFIDSFIHYLSPHSLTLEVVKR